ncbi:ubiquinone anaerobic biosynthesis accessory factor UbiT [Aeromonas cavernicola]|uniref:Ubiquinone biosynthesis accessory factor UbiT n=1 Tax=Aeromonas cavernicola TaxID=1006623 RepID=A0A2H9U644_9GAMM|nr:SCP2 sterol-binding domain-containing protein [Aeromonas cavernicola]PJG59448.1 SCP2 domain-containing protein [Aeromonas cavernicola]
MFQQLQRRLVEQAPRFLRHPLKLVPFNLQKQLMEGLLARVFKEAIADGDFEFLAGKWLKVKVTDLALCWYISEQNGQLVVARECAKADVCFSGTANDLILIAGRKEDPDSLFFQRKLKIEGDTELGLEVKNLMDSLDLDGLPSLMKYPLMDLAGLIEQARAHSVPTAVATTSGRSIS